MKGFFESAGSAGFFILFLLGQFPGGTFVMSLACNHRRLDGGDWVMSVVLPFYGLAKSLFSSQC